MKTTLAILGFVASIGAAQAHQRICFELGDSSSKSYQRAHCFRSGDQKGMLPIKCTFDNGDQETTCFRQIDGCLVCAGMD